MRAAPSSQQAISTFRKSARESLVRRPAAAVRSRASGARGAGRAGSAAARGGHLARPAGPARHGGARTAPGRGGGRGRPPPVGGGQGREVQAQYFALSPLEEPLVG